MLNPIFITVRQFPVLAHDHRVDKEVSITVPVTKEQLRAAQLVGQSSAELIERLCEKQGYTVIEIGKPDKLYMDIDLEELVRQYQEHQDTKSKFEYLYGGGGD